MSILNPQHVMEKYHRPAGLVMWRAVQLGQSFHLQHSPLFLVLLLFTMLERLTSFASDVAIERDWLTKLVGKYLA